MSTEMPAKGTLQDVLELAAIERLTWPSIVPTGLLCFADDGGAGDGDKGGDGAGAKDGKDGKDEGGDKGGSGNGSGDGSGDVDADIEAIASQAKNPDAVRRAMQAERRRAREAEEKASATEARVKEFEREKLTESERKDADLRDAKSEADTLKTENLRLRVAIEKKLPLSLADRLKGKNQKEMEADADELLDQIGRKDEAPQGDGDGGRGEGGGGGDFNSEIRKQYARG